MMRINNSRICKIDEAIDNNETRKKIDKYAEIVIVATLMLISIVMILTDITTFPHDGGGYSLTQKLIIIMAGLVLLLEIMVIFAAHTNLVDDSAIRKLDYIKLTMKDQRAKIVSSGSYNDFTIETQLLRENIKLRFDGADWASREGGLYLKYAGIDGFDVKYYVNDTDELERLEGELVDIIEIVTVTIKNGHVLNAEIKQSEV